MKNRQWRPSAEEVAIVSGQGRTTRSEAVDWCRSARDVAKRFMVAKRNGLQIGPAPAPFQGFFGRQGSMLVRSNLTLGYLVSIPTLRCLGFLRKAHSTTRRPFQRLNFIIHRHLSSALHSSSLRHLSPNAHPKSAISSDASSLRFDAFNSAANARVSINAAMSSRPAARAIPSAVRPTRSAA